MHITLHLALAAIIGFGLSEARQQEHDLGKIFLQYYCTDFNWFIQLIYITGY